MFVKTAEGWKSINVHKPSITNDIAVKGHTTLSKLDVSLIQEIKLKNIYKNYGELI